MAFDPDAYLAEPATPTPAPTPAAVGAGGFDPDAYLAESSADQPAESSSWLSRLTKVPSLSEVGHAAVESLPLAGTVLGGVLGTPADVIAGPLGNVAGAAAGSAAGKALENLLKSLLWNEGPKTLTEGMVDPAIAALGGAMAEAGGQVAGKVIGTGVSKVAEYLQPKLALRAAKNALKAVGYSKTDLAKLGEDKILGKAEDLFKQGILTRNKSGRFIPASPSGILENVEALKKEGIQNMDKGLSEASEATRPAIEKLAKAPEGTAAPLVPREVRGSVPSEEGYVYHATNEERAREILDSGELKTHDPWKFTDQGAWPDGSIKPRAYFTPKSENTWQFAPEEGRPILLRAKAENLPLKAESTTGDMYVTKPVSSSELEILGEDGKWVPLNRLKTESPSDLAAVARNKAIAAGFPTTEELQAIPGKVSQKIRDEGVLDLSPEQVRAQARYEKRLSNVKDATPIAEGNSAVSFENLQRAKNTIGEEAFTENLFHKGSARTEYAKDVWRGINDLTSKKLGTAADVARAAEPENAAAINFDKTFKAGKDQFRTAEIANEGGRLAKRVENIAGESAFSLSLPNIGIAGVGLGTHNPLAALGVLLGKRGLKVYGPQTFALLQKKAATTLGSAAAGQIGKFLAERSQLGERAGTMAVWSVLKKWPQLMPTEEDLKE